jgi:hypothetical protein
VLEEEFFRQGDRERELGLPISPLFDRAKQGVGKSQVRMRGRHDTAPAACMIRLQQARALPYPRIVHRARLSAVRAAPWSLTAKRCARGTAGVALR